jgi:hypothetical protein
MVEVPGAGAASDRNGDPASCYDFGADSASNRNEYQESYWRSLGPAQLLTEMSTKNHTGGPVGRHSL